MRTSTECNNCRGLKVTDWDTADFQLSLPDPEFNILSDLIHNYFEPQHLTGDNKYRVDQKKLGSQKVCILL